MDGDGSLNKKCLQVTRRILRKIAEGFDTGLGDTTTLVDESVIAQLISGRPDGNKG